MNSLQMYIQVQNSHGRGGGGLPPNAEDAEVTVSQCAQDMVTLFTVDN